MDFLIRRLLLDLTEATIGVLLIVAGIMVTRTELFLILTGFGIPTLAIGIYDTRNDWKLIKIVKRRLKQMQREENS